MTKHRRVSSAAMTLPEQHMDRSYGGVTVTAFRAVTGSFKAIARRLWLYALVYSFVVAYATVSCVHNLRSDVVSQATEPTSGDIIRCVVVLVLLLVTSVALYGRIASLLGAGEERLMSYMVRSLKVHLFNIALAVVVMALVVGAWIAVAKLDYLWIIYAVVFVAWLLLLPYIYVCVSYLVKGGRLRRLIIDGYREGLRHYGFIFITWLLTGITTSIVSLIVCLPMLVLLTALGMAVGGAMLGDPLNLPDYFYPLMYAVATVTYIILTAVVTYAFCVYYYMSGAIDTRTEERLKVKAGMSGQSPTAE